MAKSKPPFVVFGNLHSTRPRSYSTEQSRQWAENQALANWMRDEPPRYDTALSLLPILAPLAIVALILIFVTK